MIRRLLFLQVIKLLLPVGDLAYVARLLVKCDLGSATVIRGEGEAARHRQLDHGRLPDKAQALIAEVTVLFINAVPLRSDSYRNLLVPLAELAGCEHVEPRLRASMLAIVPL